MNVNIMDIEQQQQIRYDRQIRLWGDEGQSSIQQARICVFGSSALAAEILKNLVLAGIGSFDIIDDALVKPADLGQNFFLVESAIGKYRGECLVQLLMELNPSVHGQHAAVPFRKFSQHDLKSLLQFSLVIGTNMAATEAIQLDQFLFAHQIPFVFARVQGLLGHLRLSFREHVIWNSHSENDAYDLRLDKPFSELLKLSAETDLERMSHEQHSHTPYILLYFKAIDIWRKRHRGDIVGNDKSAKVEAFPDIKNYKTRKELEAILMEMRQPDDKGSREEENFAEAKRNLLKSMGRTKVPDNVRQLLADPKANCISSNPPVRRFPEIYEQPSVDHFWALCTALRQFIAQHDCLPVCGQLPDMTSDSKRYAQLLSVYRNKFVEDAAQLQAMATEILRQRQLGQNAQPINAATAKLKTKAKQSSRSETEDESTTDEMGEAEDEVEDEDDQLSRMSTTDAGEQVALVEEEQGMEEGTAATATAGSEYFYHWRGDSGSNQMSNSSESSTDGFGAISVEQCQKYCKNATKIGIQYGSSLSSEFTSDIGPILRRVQQPPNLKQQPQQVDPLLWYVLLRTVDRFRAKNDRMPAEPNDLRELKRCLTELFAETKDVDLIGRRDELVPTEMLNEMLRFGASEPHVIAAILGGCVAQEAIKLCTRQYIPVDNSLVFDGHSQQATTFRVTTSAHK